MKIYSNTPPKDKKWILEQSLSQIFQYLIDYKKQRHNFFQLTNGLSNSDSFGPLLFLDNDRGSWDRKYSFSNVTSCLACTFPLQAIEQLRKVGPNVAIENRLGSLLKESLSYDPLSSVIRFSSVNKEVLDYRVESILACVSGCLSHFDASSVLHTLS